MNYIETKNKYVDFRKDLAIAERDAQNGNLYADNTNTPIKAKPTKITPNKTPDIKMTPKRALILFVRDYLKDFNIITVRGLVREYKDIFRYTTKSRKQLVKDFTVIMDDLIDLGILKRYGSYRRKPTYLKIINPEKVEGLRNDRI